MLEGRTRTLSGPSPELTLTWTAYAFPARRCGGRMPYRFRLVFQSLSSISRSCGLLWTWWLAAKQPDAAEGRTR